MKSYLIALAFAAFTLSNAMGYAPTLDSLLRNGENPDVGSNTVLANLKIKIERNGKDTSPLVETQTLKYLVYNDDAAAPRLLQLEYAANSYKDETLAMLRSFPFKRLSSVSKNIEKTEQRLFYSLLALLLRNDGSMILDLLKAEGFPIKTNRELVNGPKLKLLNSYKYFLMKQKDGDTDIKNPLRPEDPEARAKVQAVFNSPFIMEDSLVKRHKNGDHFSWVVDTDKMYISFDHNHHLEELSFETNAGKFSVNLGRFLLQGAGMEFPEDIIITTPGELVYTIKLTSLKQFSDNSARQSSRLDEYQSNIKKNNLSISRQVETLTL